MSKINLIIENLNDIIDLTTKKTFKELNIIKNVEINENNVVSVELNELEENILFADVKKQIARIVKLNLGFPGVKIIPFLKEKDENDNKSFKPKKVKYIGIVSGKGGVGKSNVCANLAIAVRDLGFKVGIIDADIYGASIPNIFNLKQVEVLGTEDNKIYPILKEGIEIISTEFFNEENKPIVWRGPMLAKMLNHFFNDVLWSDDLDYMFIDLPPGTGDVLIDIQKLVPQAEMILVTTPHLNASSVAIKAGVMMHDLNHKILGVIENMSYYVNPINGQKDYVFGFGGMNEIKSKLNTICLGQIPLERPTGEYLALYDSKDKNYQIYHEIAKKII